ncbi:hypothetical protein NC652_007131 [Populus alba x Populus x berolinensis]|nr:hypothetical protein NC652_007131 [Populus alba x Populus x berolinensis]
MSKVGRGTDSFCPGITRGLLPGLSWNQLVTCGCPSADEIEDESDFDSFASQIVENVVHVGGMEG